MKTLEKINVKNKKVIIRVDYNVPIKNGKILDNNRIIQSLESIKYLIKENAKIIIMSHLGKISTKEDLKEKSILPIQAELEKILNQKIYFSNCLKGNELEKKISNLNNGEILLLENTRYMDYPNKLESNCDEELSKYWASLGDIFILDAFGSAHRAHASTYGISKYLPHAIGFLIEKEIKQLDKIKNEKKILILGGAKVADKIGLIKNLIKTSEKILIGGAMCATFLFSKGYEIGKTFVDEEKINEIKELLKTNKLILPLDVVTENGIKKINEITKNESILDIGPETIELFEKNINKNTTVLINGTLGLYEENEFSNGTKSIFNYLNKNKNKVIVCGGDTGNAAKLFKFSPYYLSTGGGASLEYLEGKKLKSLEIMETNYE